MSPDGDKTLFELGGNGKKVRVSDVKGYLALMAAAASALTYFGIDQLDLLGVQRTEQHIAHLGGLIVEKETKLQRCQARNDVLLRQLGVPVE